MISQFFFGYSIWKLVFVITALIVAGGWALMKIFEYMDKAAIATEER